MHSSNGQHPVDYLFTKLEDLDYPDGLVAVPEVMRGTAFFPGGYGLWREVGGPLPRMPLGEVMVLGQDFGKKTDYEKALRIGHELDTSTTWRHLCPLLRDARISPECCFFTNAYMGLRTGCVLAAPRRVHLRERSTRNSGNGANRSSGNRSPSRNRDSSWYSGCLPPS